MTFGHVVCEVCKQTHRHTDISPNSISFERRWLFCGTIVAGSWWTSLHGQWPLTQQCFYVSIRYDSYKSCSACIVRGSCWTRQFYRISSNRSPRLLLEPPGSPMNMILFKTPRFLVLYLLLQSEIPGGPYRRSANHAIRTDDAMHRSATGWCAISSMILAFRPPGLC